MFKRILIANRGEIALRIIRTCKKLKIETVAVYSEADKNSPHLEMADNKVCIGPSRSEKSYINMEAILAAAANYDCQAIHPGYGFLAENATFSDMCFQQKVTFIGPPASAIKAMGDKSPAKETMKKLGLPTIPGSEGLVFNVEMAKKEAEKIGYPVIIKATAGGGGKGMRICRDGGDLEKKFVEATLESEKAFGNPGLYLEKFIERGRHIEFQILADSYGNAICLGERECSIQRSHQKLVEESPSCAVSPEVRKNLGEKVCRAVSAIGYIGAGTVEFLMDVSAKQLYFMEMNTRLQVEHPVTEMVTGIDIVEEMIKIAANHELSYTQKNINIKGHAIECRINAEDWEHGFKPTPGEIKEFIPPQTSENVRLDTHVMKGYSIPPFYDSMIGKLIVKGKTRLEVIETMKKALNSFHIEDVKTTINLHQKIMATEEFIKGEYDTGFIGRNFKF